MHAQIDDMFPFCFWIDKSILDICGFLHVGWRQCHLGGDIWLWMCSLFVQGHVSSLFLDALLISFWRGQKIFLSFFLSFSMCMQSLFILILSFFPCNFRMYWTGIFLSSNYLHLGFSSLIWISFHFFVWSKRFRGKICDRWEFGSLVVVVMMLAVIVILRITKILMHMRVGVSLKA